MINKNGNITATLQNLTHQVTEEANKMAEERAQIERLKQEIKAKEAETVRLEQEFQKTERLHHQHEMEIREATEEIQRIQRDSIKEHSQTRKF